MTFITIAGASGSGKTTLAEALKNYYLANEKSVVVISSDCYYKDISHCSVEERAKTNFDHPDSIDFKLLQQHLNELRAGKSVRIPQYDFSTHARTKETKEIKPTDIIIVEGILVLHALDLSFSKPIYVDTDEEICLKRRIERDVKERSRTEESVIAQYNKTVYPMFKEFVKPSRQKAKIIVPNNEETPFDVKAIASLIDDRTLPFSSSREIVFKTPSNQEMPSTKENTFEHS